MYIQQITSIKRNSSKEKGRKDEMNFEENE